MAQKWEENGKGSGRSRNRAIIHCIILQQIEVVQHTTYLQHSPLAHVRCFRCSGRGLPLLMERELWPVVATQKPPRPHQEVATALLLIAVGASRHCRRRALLANHSLNFKSRSDRLRLRPQGQRQPYPMDIFSAAKRVSITGKIVIDRAQSLASGASDSVEEVRERIFATWDRSTPLEKQALAMQYKRAAGHTGVITDVRAELLPRSMRL